MASSTINFDQSKSSGSYIDGKIEWSSVADNDANNSDVTAKIYVRKGDTTQMLTIPTTGTWSYSLTINGSTVTGSISTSVLEDWVLLYTRTVSNISHDDDGSKSITISGSISAPSATSFSGHTTSGSGKATLDDIPRASTITSASNVTLGNKCSVKWTPASATFRYKLKFSLGDWSYTTDAIHPNKISAYTYTGYTIPLSVAEQITDDDKDTMTVTLYTYSNSGATTQVGSADSDTFTVTVPENDSTKPTLSMELAPVSSMAAPFNSLYIKGRSKVDANFTGAAKYNATVKSYKVNVNGKSYGSPYTSGYLSTVGKLTVTGSVTDSREFTNEVEEEITVIDYGVPKILPASDENEVICARCDKEGNLIDSGTYLKIKARRSYSKVTANSVQNNFCAIRYRYRPETTTTFSDWVTLLAKSNTSTDTVDSDPIANVVASAETAYIVQVGVIDDMGESAVLQFVIPTDFVTVDIPESSKGMRIGLLRYAKETDEPGIDVGAPIYGGSIDSLKLGTRLTATAAAPISLNDVKTPGCYYSPSAENSAYISDSPYADGGFGLKIRELQSANYISQTLYYGRTRWTRHWDGTEWSGWGRFLMTSEAESFAVDFVTEEGTSKGWTYKVWKSGTYEMFGIFDVTTTVAGTAYGNMYYSEQFALPTPFTCSFAVVSGTATSWFIPITGGLANNDDPNNNIGFRVLRPTSFAAGTEFSVRLHVRGKLA